MSALNELYEELECTIREYSETLIAELALRDELEYEKELKNQFISLLLSIQKKRRETQTEKKKNNSFKKQKSSNGTEPGTVSVLTSPQNVLDRVTAAVQPAHYRSCLFSHQDFTSKWRSSWILQSSHNFGMRFVFLFETIIPCLRNAITFHFLRGLFVWINQFWIDKKKLLAGYFIVLPSWYTKQIILFIVIYVLLYCEWFQYFQYIVSILYNQNASKSQLLKLFCKINSLCFCMSSMYSSAVRSKSNIWNAI